MDFDGKGRPVPRSRCGRKEQGEIQKALGHRVPWSREVGVRSLETVGADWECGDEDRGQAAPREGLGCSYHDLSFVQIQKGAPLP